MPLPQASPGPGHVLGIALLQGKTYKDVQGTGLEYTMIPVDEEKCEHEISFTPAVEGSFSLHVWADIRYTCILLDLNFTRARRC